MDKKIEEWLRAVAETAEAPGTDPAALMRLTAMGARSLLGETPPEEPTCLTRKVADYWRRRNELTDAEWIEAAPVLLGMVVVAGGATP